MGSLVLNDINVCNKEIEELKTALKKTKNVRIYNRHSVLICHFEGFTNKKMDHMEGLETACCRQLYKKL